MANCRFSVTIICLLFILHRPFIVEAPSNIRKVVTSATLPVKPLNQVNYVGHQTTLTCSTNGTTVTWTLYRLEGTTPCTVFNGNSMGTCVDANRYSVSPQTNGHYDLIITNTQMSDVGTYRCDDWNTSPGSAPADAAYTLVGSGPTMTQNPSTSCLLEGDLVTLRCEVTYNGNVLMPVSMTWTGSGGNVVYTNGTNTGGVYWSTAAITATNTNISSYNCTVTFSRPTATTIPPTTDVQSAYATNTPSYTKATISTPYAVQYCPTHVNVTQDSSGSSTSLYCIVGGGSLNVDTTYNWNCSDSGSQQNITIYHNSTYNSIYCTCHASSVIWCSDPTTRHKNCSTVNGTAHVTISQSTTILAPITTPMTTAAATTPTSFTAATTQPNTSASSTSVQPPGEGPNSCADRVECIVPAVVCSVVGGVVIIVVIVLCFKWSKCPGYKHLQHKHGYKYLRGYHENKPNENTRNGSDNKQLAPQQQTTVNAQFANDSYQEDHMETQGQGMGYQPPPDVTVGLHTQPTHFPPRGGYLHYFSHQPPQNRPPPTPQKPVGPEGIVYAELAAKPAGSRQPVAPPPSDTVYAQIQSA